MKDNLKIFVLGKACSGKSTISYLIMKTLEENGFNVEFESLDIENKSKLSSIMEENVVGAVNHIKDKVDISINEFQLSRRGGLTIYTHDEMDKLFKKEEK